MTTAELAQLLRVKLWAAYDMIRRGTPRPVRPVDTRMLRFRSVEVDALIAAARGLLWSAGGLTDDGPH